MAAEEGRWAAPRIAIVNHKGGVGKTTLTVNIAAAIASAGKRVLLVDSDPQGNLTSYLIEEQVVNDLLDNSDEATGNTIWSAVRPIVDGSGDIHLIKPIERAENLFLLPGDIRLAEFEAELSGFWGECFQRRIRGFRGTTALSALVDQLARQLRADMVFYDSGPNIGALNRVILLDSDFFIIPAAADLFSLRAINTLGHTLVEWITDWRTISELAPDDVYLLPGKPRLLGYIPQRFKVYAGRPASNYASFFPRIERAVQEQVLTRLRKLDPTLGSAAASPLKLGEIPEFGSLANASQQQGVPMALADAGTRSQRDAAEDFFAKLAATIVDKIDRAS
jgi:cellulose biosynthesis protein BcsQ